jgi:hypothetical protein
LPRASKKQLAYKDKQKTYHLGTIDATKAGNEHAAIRAYIADILARAAAALTNEDKDEHERLLRKLADTRGPYYLYAKENIQPDLRSASADRLVPPGKLCGASSYSHEAP